MISIKRQAVFDNLNELLGFVRCRLEENTNNNSFISDMILSAEEIIVNVINYGFPKEPVGFLKIEFEVCNGFVSITFTDNGIPFNPTAADKPKDISLPIQERKIGGMGIYIVHKVVDKCTYRRNAGCNVLTIEKELS